MKCVRVQLRASALLALALLYFFADGRMLAATALAAAVHELGHIFALHNFGLKIRTLRLELTGLCIDYTGRCTPLQHALAAAAGPAAGLALALIPMRIAALSESEFLCLTASLSFMLSLFNLVPLPNSDGARILRYAGIALLGFERGEKTADMLEIAAAALLFALALFLYLSGRGLSLLLSAAVILLSSLSSYCKKSSNVII